jgi:hypothetical protein
MNASIQASPNLLLDFDRDSSVLAVSFGGLFGRAGAVPTFEYQRVIADFAVRAAFVRDPRALWYHGGCEGLGSNLEEVAASLAEVVRLSECDRVVFLGGSSGGYAAILFSCLVPAHQALTFGPQTFIDPEQRAAVGDERWPAKTRQASAHLDKRYSDLRPIVSARSGSHPSPRISVHYAADEGLDAIHAKHLADSPLVDIVLHPDGGHALPAKLKRLGRLHTILERAFWPEPTTVPSGPA